MNSIKFSIIVPVFHERERINQLIEYLNRSDFERNVEIIVVDGSHEKDTLSAIYSS